MKQITLALLFIIIGLGLSIRTFVVDKGGIPKQVDEIVMVIDAGGKSE